MKSRVVGASFVTKITKVAAAVSRDRLPLFAAESSFFMCISAIPLVMLVISVTRLIAPHFVDDILALVRAGLPDASHTLFDGVVADITEKSGVPLVSFAALGVLWAASRGLFSLVHGVSQVYGKEVRGSFLHRALKAALFTASFIVVMAAVLVVLVFGKYFRDVMTSTVGDAPAFIRYKEVIIFFVLTLFFSLLYFLVAKGAFATRLFGWERGVKFRRQIPGAALAAAGWIIFSLAYSLYFDSFPRFSYLYGSLAAVVFLMLWLYFCMLILLLGAEVNKLINERKAP